MSTSPPRATGAALYAAIWRYHFYAGLFVLPFILILSVTGALYLFKPQLDRWEERAYQNLPVNKPVSPDYQLAVALGAAPGTQFLSYRLPERPGDAAMITLASADGGRWDIFVSPAGSALGALPSGARFSDSLASFHGSLLLGTWGDRLVELAASWTIILILTGLYLWWPRPFKLAGTLWPRLSLRGRPLLKDLHRVTGFWIAGLVLLMLASGLPWAGTWGSALRWVRAETGLVSGVQDWKIGSTPSAAQSGHSGHEHTPAPAAATTAPASAGTALPLSLFASRAQREQLPFPALVLPPHAPQRFGPPTGNVWTIKSETQNRPQVRQVSYDATTGAEVARSGFADKHVIDRVINTGIAWHEGQLFGLANQLMGLCTALALIALSLLGGLMWLRRRPVGGVAAPPRRNTPLPRWMIAITVVFGLLLPLFGISLVVILLADRLWMRLRS